MSNVTQHLYGKQKCVLPIRAAGEGEKKLQQSRESERQINGERCDSSRGLRGSE